MADYKDAYEDYVPYGRVSDDSDSDNHTGPERGDSQEDYSGLVDEDDDIMPVGEAQLIILMRIYDVQMALLSAEHPKRAQAVYEAHAAGKIIGPLPSISL